MDVRIQVNVFCHRGNCKIKQPQPLPDKKPEPVRFLPKLPEVSVLVFSYTINHGNDL